LKNDFYLVKTSPRGTSHAVAISPLIQQYIPNPLLLDKKKFDFRCFVLLFCTGDKYLFFFRHAYIRLTVDDFQADNATLSIHATHTSHAKKRAKNEWEKEIWINKA